MSYNKNKVNLHVDTTIDEVEDRNDTNNGYNSNQLRFRTYVNGIVEIQNIQDFIIRLSIITGLFILACYRFFAELYFVNNATNHTNAVELIYLKVSILENIVLSAITYYFIMSENIDDIYDYGIYSKNSGIGPTPNLIMLGKIEKFWSKYYSWLGITISANYYCNNRYMTPAYVYILRFSILRLFCLRYFENKKLKN